MDQDRAKGAGELLQIPHDAVVVEGEVFEIGHQLDALFATLAFYSLSDAQYALVLAGALCFRFSLAWVLSLLALGGLDCVKDHEDV